MNSLAVRLKTAIHSPAERRRGLGGTWPVSAGRNRCSVAVDKDEPPEARLLFALAPAPHHESHRRPDPTRDEEAHGERAGRGGRQLRAELPADVRRLADSLAQVVDGARQLVPLGLDLLPEGGRRLAVTSCHLP